VLILPEPLEEFADVASMITLVTLDRLDYCSP